MAARYLAGSTSPRRWRSHTKGSDRTAPAAGHGPDVGGEGPPAPGHLRASVEHATGAGTGSAQVGIGRKVAASSGAARSTAVSKIHVVAT